MDEDRIKRNLEKSKILCYNRVLWLNSVQNVGVKK